MPYRDLEKRKEAARKASLAYYYRQKPARADGDCTTCGKPVDEAGFKKCAACRKYMRQFKTEYRAQSKEEGICSRADCKRPARSGLKLCAHCAGLYSKQQTAKSFKQKRKTWRDEIRSEVLAAYGAKCVCCGNTHERVLTIDHIDGYKEGPRAGFYLYLWLKKNNFPAGFRALCMTCNFTLAHHGYCPHSNLAQVTRLGRPKVYDDELPASEKASRRRYTQKLKMDALHAYGGPNCIGCGEAHHECLSIDHIGDNGAEHRRTDKASKNTYIWLRANGYPPGFQVLCMNCQHLKALGEDSPLSSANTSQSCSILPMEAANG